MRRYAQVIDIRIEDREDGPVTVSVRCSPDPDFPDYIDTDVERAVGDDRVAVTLTRKEEFYASEQAACKYAKDE